MDYLHQELEKLNITWQNVTVLQDKDGVTVARVASGGESYVLKCFQNADYLREIQNYRILSSLGVPTIGVIASTDAALLLEDIDRSPIYRLGLAEDLSWSHRRASNCAKRRSNSGASPDLTNDRLQPQEVLKSRLYTMLYVFFAFHILLQRCDSQQHLSILQLLNEHCLSVTFGAISRSRVSLLAQIADTASLLAQFR